jgi:hypothetical protein
LSPLYRLTAGTKAARDPYTFSYPIGDFKPENGEILIVGIGFEYVQDSEGNDTLLYLPLEAELRDGVASATFVPADYLDAKEEIRCSGLERRLTEGLCIGLYYTRTYEREGDNALPGKFRILTTRSDRQLGFVNEGIADAILTDLENAYQYMSIWDTAFHRERAGRWTLSLSEWGRQAESMCPSKRFNTAHCR